MIRCEKARFTLGGKALLNPVTAEIRPGKVTALLGANGAGKSTLLRLLAGLTVPTSGSVTLDGVNIHTVAVAERARRIGLLPQLAEASWNITAGTLVSLGRLPHRSAFSQTAHADLKAVSEALSATDTAHFASRPINTLSGGERARVLLARVLATKPDWILADEPLAHLDPPHRRDVMKLLKAQAVQGRGVIVVMHDLTLAARYADDVLVLRQGSLIGQNMKPETLSAAFGIAFDQIETPSGLALIPSER